MLVHPVYRRQLFFGNLKNESSSSMRSISAKKCDFILLKLFLVVEESIGNHNIYRKSVGVVMLNIVIDCQRALMSSFPVSCRMWLLGLPLPRTGLEAPNNSDNVLTFTRNVCEACFPSCDKCWNAVDLRKSFLIIRCLERCRGPF